MRALSQLPSLARGFALLLVACAAGCVSTAPDAGTIPGDGDGDGDGDLPAACDARAAPSIDALADSFTSTVYPLMLDEDRGCIACHHADSGRQLRMGTTGFDTFHKIRTAGFFTFGPGSMFDRVDRDTMPVGETKWTGPQKDALAALTCDVLAYEASHGGALDEEFPPELLAPYDGPPPTEYDNTFLTYAQLKGRVRVQFDDDWVRDGVDRFADNIALFGGVDFDTAFIPARGATPEFLAGLEVMSEDVCGRAVQAGTGPFAGLDLSGPILDEPASESWSFAPDEMTSIDAQGNVRDTPFPVSGDPPFLNAFTAGGGRVTIAFPTAGSYTFTITARGDEAGSDLPRLELRVGGSPPVAWDVPEGAGPTQLTVDLPVAGGLTPVDLVFTNDYYDPTNPDPAQRDRNLHLYGLDVTGPLPGTTGGGPGAKEATLATLQQLLERILLRPARRDADPAVDEIEPLYALLVSLDALENDQSRAWSGVCEALLQHPDFLFTRPPSHDTATGPARERLLLIKTALDLIDRPPTADELLRYDVGEIDRAALIDEWLASDEFADAFFLRARILLETDGSLDGDEPARLLTYVFLNDRPIRDLLTAEYGVDANFDAQPRPPEHGATGVLTMPGYVRGKPGLPHYNYAARVMSGFLGYVFEVPPEVFDQRATATAASTVDPTSICYNCHQVLTPLAHQRLRWDDDGNYVDVDEAGLPIDDSDRGLVEGYPFAGAGMQAFAAQAIRKEGFIRRMANTQFQMLFGRQMRHEQDERVLYKTLWDVADSSEGTFRGLLKAILTDDVYENPVGSIP